MSTPNLSDEELDALFRQGADDYPEEVNLGAWLRMEQRLDEAEMQRRVNRKVARFFLAEVAAVALLLLLWLGYRQYTGPATAARRTQPAATQPVEAPAKQAHRSGETQLAAASRMKPAGTAKPAASLATDASLQGEASPATRPAATANDAAMTSGEAASATLAASGTAGLVAPGSSRNSGRSGEYSQAAAPKSQGRRPRISTYAATATHDAAARAGRSAGTSVESSRTLASRSSTPQTAAASTASRSTTGSGAAAFSQTQTEARGSALPPAGQTTPVEYATGAAIRTESSNSVGGKATRAASVASPDNESTSTSYDLLNPINPALQGLNTADLPVLTAQAQPTVEVAERPEKPRLQPAHRLAVSLVYSPDFSTVRFANIKAPGTNFGALLEYRFTNRLRISTGFVRSDKSYKARREDYTIPDAPTGGGSYAPSYEWVQGTCTIWDVPLNLRYDWLARAQSQGFVSAGLSSFFMKEEHYYYDYVVKNRYGTPTTYTWNRKVYNGRQHPLSVLNLSGGYERQVGSRWSVQAEPFVKIPLGGVGYGNIKLLSGGVFLGLKYGL
ncbi:hypothetical protein F0P96_06795 [Hymenobacter busanensis]|uniref:Uncharacterized protein n=1 Tax=Hymenobacter busanensis TaxID=2607656 RepID=A0A7L5A176_9BACT|nr:hypothetical protein [Hymenobacter busanensis]KAA9338535.1 hypothetical protein F0P96_06795 [Hymenobacter busanensis]QHJ09037.1 hypothetical protein GUY19_17805 [Hymenobacter busanensis]